MQGLHISCNTVIYLTKMIKSLKISEIEKEYAELIRKGKKEKKT